MIIKSTLSTFHKIQKISNGCLNDRTHHWILHMKQRKDAWTIYVILKSILSPFHKTHGYWMVAQMIGLIMGSYGYAIRKR